MTCNKLCLTLSSTSKINILDECKEQNKETAARCIQKCPLCFLVGDNCDIRIQTNHQASDHQVQDCHYFAILLIFSRMANELVQLSNVPPHIIPENIEVSSVLLTDLEKRQLLSSYKVLFGRLMVKKFKAFQWMDRILPKHIPHQHTDVMARKSTIIPMRILLKNEAKYEDCVMILDETEDILQEHFEAAQGKHKRTYISKGIL